MALSSNSSKRFLLKKNMNPFDIEYHNLCQNLLNQGFWKLNERTGKNCLTMLGGMAKYDLSTGKFPVLTTKKVYVKQMIGELLGFIRGVDSAKGFRDLGCNFWNANANESKHWVANPNRKGWDDLGRVYGVQARDWRAYTKLLSLPEHPSVAPTAFDLFTQTASVDQLANVISKLANGVDDRRLIVSHWNPAELDQMALPPCHMFYQFGIRDGYLDLCMFQRSCDIPLGVPMNVASYALKLMLVAQITGLKPGIFTHFMWNIHIYEDQLEGIKEQLTREPFEAPSMLIDPNIKSLQDLETWVTADHFKLQNYNHHPAIAFPFAE